MEGIKKHLFRWDEIPGKDDKRLREFIIHNYDPKLSRTAQIAKPDENTIKISDEDSTVSLKLDPKKDKVIVEIDDKTNEFIVKKKDEKGEKEKLYIYPTNPLQGPGNKHVGFTGIVLTAAYLFLFSLILIYSLVQFWPPQSLASESVTSSNLPVHFILWQFSISEEGRLFLIVALAGALGSSVHALRSFYWYVGHRDLVWSWIAMYTLLPVAGATLGLIFYIAIRGGLFPQATIQQTSPFGFAALSSLVGLFSVQAVLKLQNIAETVFIKAGEGEESTTQEGIKEDK